MSHALISPRRKFACCRPSVERLESRLALSLTAPLGVTSSIAGPSVSALDTTAPAPLGPNLTILGTTPAAGAELTQPITTVTVTFDRPIDPSTFGTDVVINQFVNGSWQPAEDLNNPPLETTDATGTQLILTLPAALGVGQYQLVFSGGSLLSGLDGSMLASVGTDQVLGQFTIAAPAPTPVVPTIATAPDLGSPATGLITVAGALDLTTRSGAVQLYKFELPDGHFWRLASAIDAQRIGSPLNSTLTLFDAQGNVLLSTSTGRVGALADPFFFKGLSGGTYYLGVSGFGNVPGQPGGYNPVTGQSGTASVSAKGGSFLLHLAADPSDVPTQLVSSTIDHADPLGPPTGVSLAFSGPLNMASIAGKEARGIVLVNQAGQSFPIAATAANVGQSLFSFVWNEALPAGHYTLEIPSAGQGGLTDLAGLTPVAPGQPAGTLLTFDVAPATAGPADPNNLGPLYNLQNNPVERQGTITPLAALNDRFVVLWNGYFQIEVQSSAASLAATLYGPNGIQVLNNGTGDNLVHKPIYLTRGMYILQLTNTGNTAIHVDWVLSSGTDFESLLMNGVGQGPALNMRLMSPSVDASSTNASAGVAGPAENTAGVLSGSSAGASASSGHDVGFATGSGGLVTSATLYYTVAGTLVGRPATPPGANASTSAVPGAGLVALSSGGIGVPQRIGFGEASMPGFSSTAEEDGESPDGAGSPGGPAPVDGAVVAAKAANEPEKEPDGDRQVVATAELVARLGKEAGRWLARLAGQDVRIDPTEVPADPIAVARDDAPAPAARPRGTVRYAEINTPIVIGAATVMAMQYYRPLRKWIARPRGQSDPPSSLAWRNRVRGPHGRF